MRRPVKISAVIEFELELDVSVSELDVVHDLKEHLKKAIRPEWKGFHFTDTLPGPFVGQAKRVDVTIGHDVFHLTPPAAPTSRRKKK